MRGPLRFFSDVARRGARRTMKESEGRPFKKASTGEESVDRQTDAPHRGREFFTHPTVEARRRLLTAQLGTRRACKALYRSVEGSVYHTKATKVFRVPPGLLILSA